MKDRVELVPPALPPVEPPPETRAVTGSIWAASGFRLNLVEDRRARGVGDLLTIRLVERTTASKSAAQSGNRSSSQSIDFPDLGPMAAVEQALAGGSESQFSGEGSAEQSNRLSGEMTVTVVEVLSNGVLRVAGDRRLWLTRGEEQVQVSGLVRPEDIGPDNRVASTRVADARIRYSGTGEIANQVRQGWFSRFFGLVNPY
jgi:flagellar L-ring protein precursor FlgH